MHLAGLLPLIPSLRSLPPRRATPPPTEITFQTTENRGGGAGGAGVAGRGRRRRNNWRGRERPRKERGCNRAARNSLRLLPAPAQPRPAPPASAPREPRYPFPGTRFVPRHFLLGETHHLEPQPVAGMAGMAGAALRGAARGGGSPAGCPLALAARWLPAGPPRGSRLPAPALSMRDDDDAEPGSGGALQPQPAEL